VNAGKVETFERYGFDVVMGRREGVYFYDAFDEERRFFNAHCNGGVFNLGHRNPDVLAAVQAALGSLDIGNHHLVSGHRAELARRMSATTDHLLEGVVFGVSGGEAADLAIKVVRWGTGREKIVSARGGYHGHTGLALAAGDPEFREPFGSNPPGFVQVPFDDEGVLAIIDEDTAAVILETIPATAGIVVPSPGYLQAVERRCREVGAKLVLDEVQAGLGRTGKRWGYQHEGVEPDVVICGKGLSGGVYPITATLMRADLHACFLEHPFVHISTYGGSEIGCAAATAVLDQLEAPGFLERVEAMGQRFEAGFEGLPFELRRRGLMMAFAFPGEDAGLMAAKLLYDEGIFSVYAGNDTRVLQFLPPLITSGEEADEVIEIVRRVFGG
jgi:acetylornithine/succinyldiaminopimelate/putrescine aminotransferase